MRALAFIVSAAAVIGLSPPSSGDTVIPGGAVYGTWTAAGSPYQVQGDIGVPADSTLVIEPGVQAIFEEDCGLTVTGALSAVGTAQDSITFTAPERANWSGIFVQQTAGPVQLSFCTIERGETGTVSERDGGGLCSVSTDISIDNSIFRQNHADRYGGAVCLQGAAEAPAVLSDCVFIDNHANVYGGGLHYDGPDLNMTRCRFEENTSGVGGGGVYVFAWLFGTVLVDDCYFASNEASQDGGGLMVDRAAGNGVTVSGCEFVYNQADLTGGAICMNETQDVTIEDCVFTDNWNTDLGSAVYLGYGTVLVAGSTFDGNLAISSGALCSDGADVEVASCTFSGNLAGGDGMDLRLTDGTVSVVNTVVSGNTSGWPFASVYCGEGAFSIEHCDLFRRDSGDCAGPGVPAGLGDIVGVNAVGDPCDAYSNILLDPLFCNREDGDLRIAEDSPCLGAGEGGVDIGAHGIGCETLVRPSTWGGVKAMFRR